MTLATRVAESATRAASVICSADTYWRSRDPTLTLCGRTATRILVVANILRSVGIQPSFGPTGCVNALANACLFNRIRLAVSIRHPAGDLSRCALYCLGPTGLCKEFISIRQVAPNDLDLDLA